MGLDRRRARPLTIALLAPLLGVCTGAHPKSAAGTPPQVTFAVVVDDRWDPVASAQALARALDIFKKHRVAAEIFLTAPVVDAFERSDPALLRRLKDSGMTLGYRIAPPHPLCARFDPRLQGLSPEALVALLEDYEHHALDLRTGDVDAARPGGYAWVAERLGVKPSVVAIPSEDPRVKVAARRVYGALGALRLVFYREGQPAADAPEWRESLLLDPGSCLRPSIPVDSLFWPHIQARQGDALDLGPQLERALASAGPESALPITVLVRGSTFYRKGGDPESVLYSVDGDANRPRAGPYALAPPQAPRRAGAMQEQIWSAFEQTVVRATQRGRVIDTAALLAQNAACERGPTLPPDVTRLRDVEFCRRGNRPLLLELLRPRHAGPRPALLFLHGGAWRFGSKDDLPPLATRLLDSGIVFASADYRPSTEAAFPGPLEDARDALRYLRTHAREHGIDPSRIGVWGESSGGHLAALLATTARKPLDQVVAAAASFAPTDLARLTEPPLGSAVTLLLGRSSLAAEASPLSHVSAASPPFLFVHGDRDQTVPLDQSRRMVTALSQAGADARLVVMASVGHGQYDARGESEILAFFRRRLGGTAP